ncbi:MAG: hypothetical protein K5872_14170 [Rhizobiaceae bacterium]|nr:hypothetical protein [Rhizobiaceae bacterium]MCV0407366.1 hypothetical protein [Rhizobiaceae bacterium]
MIAAVLTGDIVASSKMSPDTLAQVRQTVLGVRGALEDWHEGAVIGAPEFFRGDSWQLILARPGLLLRACLLVRGRLKGARLGDTRIAVGVGEVTAVDEERVSLSTGEAFELSGRALDAMKGERMALTMAPAFGAVGDFASATLRLCDAMFAGWTARQAEIAAVALEAGADTYGEIARRLGDGLSEQAVGKAVRSIGLDAVSDPLAAFEDERWLKTKGREKQPKKVVI